MGAEIIAIGLKQSKALNGRRGSIVSYDRGARRYKVRLLGEDGARELRRRNVATEERLIFSLTVCGVLPVSTVTRNAADMAIWSMAKHASQRSGRSDNLSNNTTWSTASSIIALGHCFAPGTSFPCPDGTLARVEDIQQHEILVGHHGTDLEVFEIKEHEAELREMVLLHTHSAKLLVTGDHRIVIPRGGGHQTIPASRLKAGDVVACGEGSVALAAVETLAISCPIYEITFRPDEAIETFSDLGAAILTKGTRLNSVKTRRGGMKKKHGEGKHDERKQDEDLRTFDPWF